MATSDASGQPVTPTPATNTETHTANTMAPPQLDWLSIAKNDTTRNEFLKCITHELSEIPARVWAFAMVVPVDKLKQLIDSLNGPLAPLFKNLDTNIKTALGVWQQQGTREVPVDEDNNQRAKKRKTSRMMSVSTPEIVSEATSEVASEVASEATEQGTEQPSDYRVKMLVTQVCRDITDFYLLRKLI